MTRSFVDSNVVVYAYSEDERALAAEAVLRLAPVISVQVLAEFTSVARRKLGFDWARINRSIADLLIVCTTVLPISMPTHSSARGIAERFKLRIYDATIIASALESGCDTLFSEDMRDGMVIEGALTIRDPFRPI